MAKRTKTPTTPAEQPAAPVAAPAPPAAPKAPVFSPEESARISAAAHARLTELVPAERPCGCGCGGSTKGRFVPGHDARLLSRLIAEEKAKVLASREQAA